MASAKISNFVLRMDEIQKLVDPDLKKLGFKKSARTYNHSIEKGIIRVIHFQMGAFDPPNIDATPVPQALKPDLYGKFAVNIGVYVAEIAQAAFPHKERKFVSESSCALRMRLGRTKNKEFWWNLSAPIDVVAENVRTLLLADGMAFLNQFSTRAAIISEWVQFNEDKLRLTLRARLDVGIMLAAAGQKSLAASMFQKHLATSQNNSHHHEYVIELAKKLGIDLGT